jgi:hypothetical protein
MACDGFGLHWMCRDLDRFDAGVAYNQQCRDFRRPARA